MIIDLLWGLFSTLILDPFLFILPEGIPTLPDMLHFIRMIAAWDRYFPLDLIVTFCLAWLAATVLLLPIKIAEWVWKMLPLT